MTRATCAIAIALMVLLVPASAAIPLVAGVAPQAASQPPAAPVGSTTVRIGVLRNGAYEIVTLPLEVYVARVLAGEAAPDTPPAALEALAVAIRTYTITNRSRHAAEGFDLCDQTHCQVMRNAYPATDRAALATAEQILLYGGAPATVYYSASCGGRSEKPSNVWPGAEDPPYLSVHDDDGCGGFPQWSAELGAVDLERALTTGGFRGTLRDVRIAARNDSGRVSRLTLDGMTPREISGQDLRMVVGRSLGFQHLQSTAFDLQHTGRGFRFTGHGNGHGVGLCVIGSMKLASAGQSATTILRRYFPGTQIGPYGARLTAAPPERPTIAAPPLRVARLPPPVSAPFAVGRTELPSSERRDERVLVPDTGDVRVILPPADAGEHAALVEAVTRERDAVAQALGVERPKVTVRLHESSDAFERATGRPWFALGAVTGGEIQLTPLWLLRDRGMLERTLRHQLVHLMADPLLPERPAWVREGAAVHFAEPDASVAMRPPCPQDADLLRPVSLGALGDAYARARSCFERQISNGRDWRRVR